MSEGDEWDIDVQMTAICDGCHQMMCDCDCEEEDVTDEDSMREGDRTR